MRQFLASIAVLLAATTAQGQQAATGTENQDNPLIEGPTWAELKDDIAGEVPLLDGTRLFAVEAPYRANDAATVPVIIEQTDPAAGPITAVSLIIDENPSPVAAEIKFGPAMSPLKFETRVRVNQYSNIRVIADTPTGRFMNGRFVKASGGCSAPATKDPEAALAGMGDMRLKIFGEAPAQSNVMREAQIMIRHPNYSGLQRDQITQLFIGAHFINELELRQGDELLFSVEGGISISENPTFRFSYRDNGADSFTIHAVDTQGNVFDKVLPKPPPA